MDYVDSLWKDERVILVGDLNDILTDGRSNNIFQNELDDTSNYRFADLSVANIVIAQSLDKSTISRF